MSRLLTQKPFARLDELIKRAVKSGHGQKLHQNHITQVQSVRVTGWTPPVLPKMAETLTPIPCRQVQLWKCQGCKTHSKRMWTIPDTAETRFPLETLCAKCRKNGVKPQPPFVSMSYVMKHFSDRRGQKAE